MYLNKLNKDKIRRILSSFFEVKLKSFKNIFGFKFFSLNILNFILKTYYYFPTNCYFSKVNNMCIITGRQNGIYRLYKVSRIKLRDSKYNLFALRKSSW